MKFIFLITAFGTFFYSGLIFQKKPRAFHDKILISWLIYLGFYIGVYSFYSHELFTHFHLMSVSLLSLLMLHGPFMYLYVLSLVSDKSRIRTKDFLHLLPLLFFNGYILIASLYPGIAEKLNLEELSQKYNPPILFLFFLILTAISGPVYFLLIMRLFRKLDINIFNNYSSSAGIDLGWLRKLVIVFGIIWTILISVTVIHHVFNMFSIAFCTDGLFLSLSIFVMLIGYFGLKQRIIFSSEDVLTTREDTTAHVKYAGSRLTDSEAQRHAEKLIEYMRSSKPYLNPDLSLSQLAGEIGITSHYLSQVINEKTNLNFFDFINGYRVDAFKERISDPRYANYSFLGIAFECGFNSKSAFNRIFKQVTGLTPSQFKESQTITNPKA